MQVSLHNAQSGYVTPSAFGGEIRIQGPGGAPVQGVQRLEGPAGHDPKVCEHCLAGAKHEFSADGDETVVSAGARQDSGEKGDATGPVGLAGAAGAVGPGGRELTVEDLGRVRELAARDREVRAHEQAHLAAAGAFATGGPSFTFQTGPDGKRYAVGGEVGIDTSPVSGNPQATLDKARTIIAAANAPAEPSSQDRAVAAAAAAMAASAQAELSRAAAVAQYSRNGETPSPSIDVTI